MIYYTSVECSFDNCANAYVVISSCAAIWCSVASWDSSLEKSISMLSCIFPQRESSSFASSAIASSTNNVYCDDLSLAFDLGAVVITPRALLTTDGIMGSRAPRTISSHETSTDQPNGILQRGQRIPDLVPPQAQGTTVSDTTCNHGLKNW
jgi:hypothetical protein